MTLPAPGRHICASSSGGNGLLLKIGRLLRAARGQTLVEFALVIPVFLMVLMGVLEFAFMFNAVLSADYATRDGALLAAEAGDSPGGDCAVLKAVDADFGPPAGRTMIQTVEIFESNAAGSQIGGSTIYARTGSYSCTLPDGTSITLPYSRTANGYPMANRCNILVGCGGQPLDFVGVRVTYHHSWKTPLGGTFGTLLTVIKSNSMRMEPIL